ncbi:MAG TPA: DUF2852 domain-containing protein [Methylocella sp.]|nr:DUF2852 domain-containing protein [Methylocella sp.]
MSADPSGSCQFSMNRRPEEGRRAGCVVGEPWKFVEVLAMVLGFVVFWPIGLAVLGWKIWQKKSGYPGDLLSFGQEKWRAYRSARDWGGTSAYWPGSSPSGNRAFDEWRASELARLEEERKKLAMAEREFAAYMENLRHARDREEFERFMDEWRRQPS